MRFIFAFERGRKEDHIRKVHCEASLSRYFKVLLWLITHSDCFDMDVLDTGENAELLALQRIDETCVRLQEQGKYLEALECMERGLVLRQHFFGADSDEVWKACTTVGELSNLLAMTYLQQENFPMTLELLKKAEILTERDERGRAVTFNNLACYYRRQGKLHSALTYLQKAMKIEQRLENVENRADTHLNLCAVLSQLGRHAGALEYAQSALILLQEELFSGSLADDAKKGEVSIKADRIAVLAIAYHNIGVEQEFLKKYDASLMSYRKGVEVSEKHLGGNHGITITLRNSFIAARQAALARNPEARSPKKKKKGARRKRAANAKKAYAARSPTEKDEEKWKTIADAYGNVPGVTPVEVPREPVMEGAPNVPDLDALPTQGSSILGDDANDTVGEKHVNMLSPRREGEVENAAADAVAPNEAASSAAGDKVDSGERKEADEGGVAEEKETEGGALDMLDAEEKEHESEEKIEVDATPEPEPENEPENEPGPDEAGQGETKEGDE